MNLCIVASGGIFEDLGINIDFLVYILICCVYEEANSAVRYYYK